MAHRLFIAGGFVTALVASAACAAEPPALLDGLQRYCVSNNNQIAPILAEADADGWQPAAVVSPLLHMSDEGGRTRKDGAMTSVLVVGDAKVPAGETNVDASICVVWGNPSDSAATVSAVSSWTKVAPNPGLSNGNMTVFTYVDDQSGRHAVLDQRDAAEGNRLLATGNLRIVFVATEPGRTLIGYAIPKL